MYISVDMYFLTIRPSNLSFLTDWLTAVSPDRCIVCEITLIAATAEASGSMLAAHQSPSVIFQHSLHHCTTSCPSLLWLKSQVNALRSRKIFWVIAFWSSAFTATNNIKKKKKNRKKKVTATANWTSIHNVGKHIAVSVWELLSPN